MSKSLFAFVFFATGWGPTEGGINAVNFDLCNAMGDSSDEKNADIYCIFSGGEPLDQEKTKANNHKVILHHVHEDDFHECNFGAVIERILEKQYKRVYWVGHDVVSGKQAIECKKKYGGKTVLFHHMHYYAYYGVAKSADECRKKDNEQREIFGKADYAIAVGPHLYDSLVKNIVVGMTSAPKCGKIIPGLANIDPICEIITNPMTVLFTGRLEEENAPVKQYTVPLLAVSDFVKEHNCTLDEINITLIGLKGEEIDERAQKFKNLAKARAGREINVHSLRYTTSREALFDIVKRSLVTVMPSISEGFGLAGYESIAAGVPTIISKNSGLYKFLKGIGLEHYVYVLDVTGDEEKDVNSVSGFINSIVSFNHESKKKAIELRDKLIELGYTWAKTAEDTYSFLLADISELSLSIQELISDEACRFLSEKVSDDYVLIMANSCIDELAEKLKVDKQTLFPKSIDKLSSVKKIYNHENSLLIAGGIKVFLEHIIKALKDNGASEDVLANFTNDKHYLLGNEFKENANIRGEDDATAIENDFRKCLKKEMREIITSVKIDAIFTENDEKKLKKYHKRLLQKPEHDTIDFRGVAVVISDDPTQSKVKLKDIYVPISLKEKSINVRYKRHRIEDFPENCDRLIIVGDPGSGKSTYLKNKLREHCGANSKRICVFIRVADFVKQIDFTIEQKSENLLERYIETTLKEMSAMDIYAKLKSAGSVSYFIDGLDEVQDSKKKESVQLAIIEFISKSNNCKFYITSRKIGLDVQPFNALDFEVREIAPLTLESIHQYIVNWYTFIAKLNKKNYKENIEKLKSAIDQDKALFTLATNPLLLSIIAILHYHGKKLPNNKAALYKTITETLLQTWMEHRNFTVLNELQNLDNQDLTNVFSRAAYWMIENKYSEMTIGEHRLGIIYEDYCKEKKKGVRTPPKTRLLEYISQDAGIVVDGGKDDGESLYQFLMHRQFAEYYAAMELDHKLSANDGQLVSKLEKILDEPKWTEVSILMCDHLHTFGESGDVKAQNYIMQLFGIKSKPIEDFQINIALILKWITNGVILNKEIMQMVFKRLDIIFRSPNRFRAIQFSEDIIKAFADSANSWYRKNFCDFIKNIIDSDEYHSISNAAIILNLMLKQKKSYKKILTTIGENRILKALKYVIEQHNFYMLVRENGCYNVLFREKYVKCVNEYFDNSDDKNLWISYTTAYAFDKKNSVSAEDIETLIQGEENLFKNDVIRSEFINSIIYWGIAIGIAENESECDSENLRIDMDRWGCRAMIESAISIKNNKDIGMFCANYSMSYTRLYHMKAEGEHIFTLFFYNRDDKIVEKRQIVLPCQFDLEYLREQIKNKNIKDQLPEYTYLDNLDESEMTKEELKELFEQTYKERGLLTGETWNQFVIDKIAEDGDVFYKNFETIKREIKSYQRLDISNLEGEFQIYFKYLLGRRVSALDSFGLFTDFEKTFNNIAISKEDKDEIISIYEHADDEERKAVLYEILYNLRNIE